jgi:hypothetical protein
MKDILKKIIKDNKKLKLGAEKKKKKYENYFHKKEVKIPISG